jgi:hypothetical protein
MAVPTSVIIFVVISPGSLRYQFPWAGAREPLIGVAGLLLCPKSSSLYRFETIAACLPLVLVTLTLPRFLKPAPTENDIGSETEAAESLLTMRQLPEKSHFDYLGTLLLILMILFLVVALQFGGKSIPWSHPLLIVLLVA